MESSHFRMPLNHSPSTSQPPRTGQFIARLRERLADDLPGGRAQAAMSHELSYGRHRGPAPGSARKAAVALVIYPRGDAWQLPLTVRRHDLPDHPGQISLPGGMIEEGESSQQSALRELDEELGISTAAADGSRFLSVLGRLTPIYVFASDFHVDPWVVAAAEAPELKPNPAEVERAFELPLHVLADPDNQKTHRRSVGGVEFEARHFEFERFCIWGATSMILAEFAAVLGRGQK